MENQTEQQILEFLKKISEYIDKQHKIQKRAWIIVLFVPIIIGISITIDIMKDMKAKEVSAQIDPRDSWDWYDVNKDQEHGKHELALKKAAHILNNSPHSSYANKSMGKLYVRLGRVKEAIPYFQKAYELWPCEDNKEKLYIANKLLGGNEALNNQPNKKENNA